MRTTPIDFIGIGVPKAATTWVYQCLAEHPDVCMSSDKEVDFFLEENYEKGDVWYAQRFSHCREGLLQGEYSPKYFYDASAPQRIFAHAPEAKLLLILRDPVERFLSAVHFEHAMGRYGDVALDDVLAQENTRNLHRGMYAQYLKRWLAVFPRKQLLICFHEHIVDDPAEFMRNIYRFLGVDDTFVAPSTRKRLNVTTRTRTRSKLLKRIYYRLYRRITNHPRLSSFLRALGLGMLARHAIALITPRTTGFEQSAERPIPPEVRERLIAQYRSDANELIELLEDMPDWQTMQDSGSL